jgi:hypothetical protein
MAHLAKGIALGAELVKNLNFVRRFQPAEIVDWDVTFDNDWSGDPAIFFSVVLTDEASKPENLRKVTTAFTDLIEDKVNPLNNWGVFPYFTFRSVSEQAKSKN